MPRPLILFCAALARDGVARNTVYVANALARRGAAVEVVCLEAGPLADDLDGPALTRLGRPPGPRPLALAAAVPALRARFRQAGAVVSMGNHAHLAVWAALQVLPGLPRLYRISNDPFHAGEPAAIRRLRGAGLSLIVRDGAPLVSVSSVAARRPAFEPARREGRLHVAPNGVDVAAIRARAAEPCAHPWLSDGALYLAAVGRLHRQKNVEALIQALAVLRAGAWPDLRLLVLGGGGARRRRRLEALARNLGLQEAVRFEGEVANPFPLVARAAAYVLPSRWEGASNSLLEALACGVPVVAAVTAGSAPEVLAGGRYGALASPEPQDLAHAIGAQLDPATRVLPRDRAADYSLEAAVERFCDLVLAVRDQHGEIQIRAAAPAHLAPVGRGVRGR
ncbi:glycosyltransferase [Phenylobacterium sp.]|uniref:glycosyltransferase n=1 Tax=Phenylobacterium sp. TaxID=1871053 RepID=UPI0028118F7E|nr:glycosyltransferase [Phenylobacterium sp.]